MAFIEPYNDGEGISVDNYLLTRRELLDLAQFRSGIAYGPPMADALVRAGLAVRTIRPHILTGTQELRDLLMEVYGPEIAEEWV